MPIFSKMFSVTLLAGSAVITSAPRRWRREESALSPSSARGTARRRHTASAATGLRCAGSTQEVCAACAPSLATRGAATARGTTEASWRWDRPWPASAHVGGHVSAVSSRERAQSGQVGASGTHFQALGLPERGRGAAGWGAPWKEPFHTLLWWAAHVQGAGGQGQCCFQKQPQAPKAVLQLYLDAPPPLHSAGLLPGVLSASVLLRPRLPSKQRLATVTNARSFGMRGCAGSLWWDWNRSSARAAGGGGGFCCAWSHTAACRCLLSLLPGGLRWYLNENLLSCVLTCVSFGTELKVLGTPLLLGLSTGRSMSTAGRATAHPWRASPAPAAAAPA